MDQLMKSYMAIMADRDAAIRERNIALVEKRKALADRDIAIMQRDTVVSERNTVVMERDDAIYQLHYHSSSLSCNNNLAHDLSINGMPRLQTEAACNPTEGPTLPDSEITSESVKSKKKIKKTKEKKVSPTKKSTKPPKKIKKVVTKNLKDNLSLELGNFDGASMCVPVCSCTGNLQPCYKWGKGGWQSACCTNNISMFPLPQLDNKRHSRIGGRKMSGSVYAKLISRLASEGHDLSTPVDLKEHWARHGTNRYITIR